MRRVLILAGYFYPHVGGYEILLYELSRRLVKAGCEVDIVTCDTEKAPAHEMLDGVSVYRIPSWNLLGGVYPVPKPSPATFWMLWKVLRKEHDSVHTYTRFFLTSLVGLALSKLKRRPLFHVELGSRHSVVSNRMVDIISRAYDHTLGSLVVRGADKLISNCKAGAGFLRHLGARKEISLIPDGVDLATFRRRETDLRDRLSLDGALVITTVSRLIYAKGVQDLVSAFPRIKQEVPNVRLLVVGDGPYREELERLARQVDGKDIVFLGRVPRQQVAEVLSITDVFVSPSYSESLSARILEAGAVGVASVATDVGGTREVVESYKTGLLVAPGAVDELGEKVCELLKNRDLREELAANMRRNIESMGGWDSFVQRHLEAMESVSKP